MHMVCCFNLVIIVKVHLIYNITITSPGQLVFLVWIRANLSVLETFWFSRFWIFLMVYVTVSLYSVMVVFRETCELDTCMGCPCYGLSSFVRPVVIFCASIRPPFL